MMQLIGGSVGKDLLLSISSFVLAFGIVLIQQEETTHVKFFLGILLITLGSIFFISMTKMLQKMFLATSYGLNFVKQRTLSVSECMDICNKYVAYFSIWKFPRKLLRNQDYKTIQFANL